MYVEVKRLVDTVLVLSGNLDHPALIEVYFKGMYLGYSGPPLSIIGFASSIGFMSWTSSI